jgi:hypothetical protein
MPRDPGSMKSIDPGSIRLERAGHIAGHDAIVTRGGRCHLRNGFLNHASQPMTGYSRNSMASCSASSSLRCWGCLLFKRILALKLLLSYAKSSDVQDGPAIQEHSALQSARPGTSSNNLRSADSIVKISA